MIAACFSSGIALKKITGRKSPANNNMDTLSIQLPAHAEYLSKQLFAKGKNNFRVTKLQSITRINFLN